MPVAPLVASWNRHWPRQLVGPVGSPGGASPFSGIPWLQNTGLDARLSVEIAWGADLKNQSPNQWAWVDVTEDVYQAGGNGITITIGRGDESETTQPSNCSMVLNNRLSRYSIGVQSPNWPYVRRNTPVRVRAALPVNYPYPSEGLFLADSLYLGPLTGDGEPFVLFQGFATSFTPDWDVSGVNATVKLTASGALRRLEQNDTVVESSLRRSVPNDSDVVAYWPCEDLKAAKSIASAVSRVGPMQVTGVNQPEFESSDVFLGSKKLPKIHKSTWTGIVPTYENIDNIQEFNIRALLSFGDSVLDANKVLLRVITDGSVRRVDFEYRLVTTQSNDGATNEGRIVMAIYNRKGTLIDDTSIETVHYEKGIEGHQVRLSAYMSTDEAGVPYGQLYLAEQGSRPGLFSVNYLDVGTVLDLTGTKTTGRARKVVVSPNADVDDVIIGHISVEKQITNAEEDFDGLSAHAGETATDRIRRLCNENGIPIDVYGTSTTLMGPQTVDTALKLLRECEVADQGILLDGLGPGLTYFARSIRESSTPSLTVDSTSGDMPMPFAPVDDDQRNVNRATAKRERGSEVTFEDVDGPLGTATIGVYDKSISVNIEADALIANYASWLVRLGTEEGYRYPTLTLLFHKSPHLFPAWLYTKLGGRIDVTNIEDVRTQHPSGTLSSLMEGYTLNITQMTLDIVANCTLYDPWNIGVVAADSGDTSDDVLRLDTDDSELEFAVEAGGTSLSVITNQGPIWTTDADDVPFDIEVDGVQITVTAISSDSSPQTFTVDPLTVARRAGAFVRLWKPRSVGL